MAKITGVGSPLTPVVDMKLKETLAHLKSLGNEKVRTQIKSVAPAIISLVFRSVISGR